MLASYLICGAMIVWCRAKKRIPLSARMPDQCVRGSPMHCCPSDFMLSDEEESENENKKGENRPE